MSPVRPVRAVPPVAGGMDVDLPGRGIRLRATRWPGSGTPVLLLHGLASTRRIWDLVVPGLAGLPVLALDQRGHGESDRPPGPYDGESVVADALTALDAVGLSRVVVVGHSWGAWTALRLAATAPERLLSVVCLDGGTLDTREQETPREPDLLDADRAVLLPQVRCPAWLVSCSPDAARADALERTARLLASPRVLRWDGAVHDVPLQWPALVAGLVRAAAEEVSRPPSGEGAGA